MIKPKLSQDLKMTLTSSLAVGAVAGAAGADVVTVLDPDQTVLTTNQVAVSVFSPTLNLTPVGFYGYTLEPNAVNMIFTAGYYGTIGFIQSNHVLPDSPPPIDSPSLLQNAGQALNNLGTTVDATRTFDVAFPYSFYGSTTWITATLNTGLGEFSLFAYADGDFGYLGYSDSALENFGYLQIQRQDLTTWRLIGYRFGTAGEAILVEDLTVPTPPALAVLAVAGLFAGGRKRRAS